jgi:nucleoside 2-deoxyribosyltransferase
MALKDFDASDLGSVFELGGMIAKHIWDAVERGDTTEVRRLADVWPEPIASRLVLMAQEAEVRRRVREMDDGDGG